MRNKFKAGLAALMVAFTLLVTSGGVSFAQDFQKGLEAAQKGDYATALREWAPLAQQGEGDAQHVLGYMYERGDGVTQNYKEAVKWYRKSAEQGTAPAQYNLGLMYANGQGVIQDNVYAHMWWNIAASTGHANAATNRELVAKRMTPAQLAEAQKLARECVRKQFKGC